MLFTPSPGVSLTTENARRNAAKAVISKISRSANPTSLSAWTSGAAVWFGFATTFHAHALARFMTKPSGCALDSRKRFAASDASGLARNMGRLLWMGVVPRHRRSASSAAWVAATRFSERISWRKWQIDTTGHGPQCTELVLPRQPQGPAGTRGSHYGRC